MAKKTKTDKTVLLPDGLTDEAKRFITAIINDLKENDRLEKSDTASLYLLANSCNLYIQAHQHIKEEGMTFTSDRNNLSISPYVTIARDAQKQIMQILESYGGTLRARQKLKELDIQVEESPLTQFIREAQENL